MNERYSRERAQIDLALSMIEREARTNTIKRCTGLSDDRIRRLCNLYFSRRDGSGVRRRRGKSPHQVARFVKNPTHQLEATTLMHLLLAADLVKQDTKGRLVSAWQTPSIDVGRRFCRVFDLYRSIHNEPLYGFEWGWNLMLALCRDDELAMTRCGRCHGDYLHDRYALDFHICPACEIRTEQRRRPGARQYADS
ncbi:MAG: hypothetical protein AB8F65_07880 [Woeseiaceae bacterium]